MGGGAADYLQDRPLRRGAAVLSGRSGFLDFQSWDEVAPCSRGYPDTLPDWEPGGVVVVAHNFASRNTYEALLRHELAGLKRSWNGLGDILRHAGIAPRNLFLTNAILGAPEMVGDEGKVTLTPAFEDACLTTLSLELRLLRPRLVLSFGAATARMLGSVIPELAPWRVGPQSPVFTAIDQMHLAVTEGVVPGGEPIVAVALTHFSRGRGSSSRRQYGGLTGWAAEVEMIRDANRITQSMPRPSELVGDD